jgi:hypothetical protein
MIAGPIGGAIASVVSGSLLETKPSYAQRSSGPLGAILRGFTEAGGDISKVNLRGPGGVMLSEFSGMYTEAGRTPKDWKGSVTAESRGLRHETASQLNKMGLPWRLATMMTQNIMPKLLQGRKLPAAEAREINELLQEILISQEINDIMGLETTKSFEDFIAESAESRLGITEAANGYSGMVSEPTLFLAGEAGPEMVDITPSSRMSGGFSGSGGSNFHFNFSVNTIDEQGVRSFIEQDAKPFIVQMLNRESTRGSTVMYSTGLTTDPSV